MLFIPRNQSELKFLQSLSFDATNQECTINWNGYQIKAVLILNSVEKCLRGSMLKPKKTVKADIEVALVGLEDKDNLND